MATKTTITLTIDGKNATGDGTVIVCLNKDYEVLVKATNCASFNETGKKYLIVRHGRDYYECLLTFVSSGTYTQYKVDLPALKRADYVELGVCGKTGDNPEPLYCSKSARFKCDKSILSDAVFNKNTFILKETEIKENGTFYAVNDGAEGYSKVKVNVTNKLSEERTLQLAMGTDGMVITPSTSDRLMTKVIIQRPDGLRPENIVKGVNIGGVIGTYEAVPNLLSGSFDKNGTYGVPSGYAGYSEVTVAVPAEARPTDVLEINSNNLQTFQGNPTDVSAYGSVYVNLDTFSV